MNSRRTMIATVGVGALLLLKDKVLGQENRSTEGAREVPPHWMDDDFTNGSPKYKQFTKKSRFAGIVHNALGKAQNAFDAAKKRPKGKVGPSPARAARMAFISELKASLDNNSAKVEATEPEE